MADVKKIILDIDGKEIKLTLKQAKDLRNILCDMWPRKVGYRYSDWYYTVPHLTTPDPPWTISSVVTDEAIYMSTTGE